MGNVWDIRVIKKRKPIVVSYVYNWGEIGQDMWLITVWTDKIREDLATQLWGGGEVVF